MTIAVLAAPATDLLGQAIETVRPHLCSMLPIGERVRNLWAGVVASRGLAAGDVIEAEFIRLAQEIGLARDLGRHADEHLRHVVRLGLLNRDPFG